jgi:hypothetical protein
VGAEKASSPQHYRVFSSQFRKRVSQNRAPGLRWVINA